jgi:predicted dehydrogenase
VTGPPGAVEPPLRVGLVGYGLGGEAFHAPLIAATPGLRLSAVVTRDPERASRARRRHGPVRVVERAEEVWTGEPLDVVVVTSPNRTHVPIARAALAAGAAVVVDKPLAVTSAEAEELVLEAERSDLLLTVFHNRRWDGDFRTLARLLGEGALGDVLRFESRFERWQPEPKPGWRMSPDPEDAGGLLYDLGSHLIDQALVLFGPVRSVYAELDRRREGVGVDDDAFLALEHEGGTRSHLWMSALAGQRGPRMRVLGTRAAWTKHGMDVQEAALRQGRGPDEGGWGEEDEASWGVLGTDDDSSPVPTERGDYRAFYARLVLALRQGGAPPVDPRDAVRGLRVIEAARASAADRRVVTLPAGA